MKSLHWYVVLGGLVLFPFLNSCTFSDSSLDNIKKVDVLNVDSPLKIAITDLVDSISYIPLSADGCLLSSIQKVQYDCGFFFVKDSKGLYVFNEYGTFINEIGKKGPGPKEYRYINAFFLDKEKKNVCIISHPDGRLLTYSYSGNFISVSRLKKEDANVSSVTPMSEGQLLVYCPLSNNINDNEFEYVMMAPEEDTYVSSPLLENINISSRNVEFSFFSYPVTFFKGKYYAISTFSNIVYSYKEEALKPEFCLDIPDISPTKAFIKSHSDLDFFSFSKLLDEEKIGKGIMAITSSGDNLFMSIKGGQTVICDGKEAIVFAPMIYNPDVDIYSYTLFTGGLFDDVIGHYGAEDLLLNREYINERDNSILKQIVSGLHEEDNPILFRCHLKPNVFELLKKKI